MIAPHHLARMMQALQPALLVGRSRCTGGEGMKTAAFGASLMQLLKRK